MSRVRLNVLLYVVVMVAAALLVVAAVTTLRDDDTPTTLPVKGVVELDEASGREQQRYADILDSASTEATAFVNIRYDDAQASIDAVMEGATGAFRDQYAKSTEGGHRDPHGEQVDHDRRGALDRCGRPGPGLRHRDRRHQRHGPEHSRPATSPWRATSGCSSSSSTRRAGG